MKRIWKWLLCGLLLLTAFGIMLYPMISTAVNEKYASVIEVAYEEEVKELDTASLDAAWEEAEEYNRLLSNHYSKEDILSAERSYDDLLDPSGNGIMGYIDIPKLSIHLPIYHGTSASVLDKGIGHLVGSSLPIGGEGTHCVLTGHSGSASNRLFSDIDGLEYGDIFRLEILNRVLTYKVCDINTVLPYETELLEAIKGEDLCTLVTCTPFGVNTHRLLVRGERCEDIAETTDEPETEAKAEEQETVSTWEAEYRKGLFAGMILTAAIIILLLMIRVFQKQDRHGKHFKTKNQDNRGEGIKSVFEAALPPQKHHRASKTSPSRRANERSESDKRESPVGKRSFTTEEKKGGT